jgi:hypothetical protein
MYRSFIVALTLTCTLGAQTLQEIISHTLESHNSLKAIEQKLSSLDELQALTQNFANPELSLSVSDIQLNDISNRSIEPMQYTALSFKQKIPYFGKRDAASKLVKSQKEVLFNSLEEAKIRLAKEIKLVAFRVWEMEKKRAILDEYIELSDKNIELSSAYNVSGEMHIEIMTMHLILSDLKVKRATINSTIEGLYSKLSYLSSLEVSSVELEVDMFEPKTLDKYLLELKNNKRYKMTLAQMKSKESEIEVKKLASSLDPVVSVGYFYRESFEDYLSFSIGSALPIYGSESLATQKVRKEKLEATYRSSDVYESLKSKLKLSFSNLKNSYKVYEIIKEESLPELEHMVTLSNTMLKNGNTLLLYIKLLEKRLSLQEKLYSAQATFKRAEAEITALRGEI